MQKPDSRTPVDRLASLSLYASTAMRRFVTLTKPDKKTAAKLLDLAKAIDNGAKPVAAKQAALRDAVLACVGPRVEVRIVDRQADQIVRSVQRLAEEAGVDEACFPDGVTPIVRPVGQTEVDEIGDLVKRIRASKWDDKSAQIARLEGVSKEYEGALAKRSTATGAVGQARAYRDSAREDFLDLYASVSAGVVALFPRDRALQDIFFDDVRTSAADDSGDDPTPAPSTPAS